MMVCRIAALTEERIPREGRESNKLYNQQVLCVYSKTLLTRPAVMGRWCVLS